MKIKIKANLQITVKLRIIEYKTAILKYKKKNISIKFKEKQETRVYRILFWVKWRKSNRSLVVCFVV